MIHTRTRIIALCFLSLFGCKQQPPQATTATAPLVSIPTGAVIAHLHQPVFPPRLVELTNVFNENIAKNREWFQQYGAKHTASSQALPYHPNMGLTEPEYAEFNALRSQVQLQEYQQAIIQISPDAVNPALLRINGGDDLPYLTGLTIDTKHMSVVTPLGPLKEHTILPFSPERQLKNLGPWEGHRWTLQQGTLNSPNAVFSSIELGRLSKSNQVFLYYRGSHVKDGTAQLSIQVLMLLKHAPPQ